MRIRMGPGHATAFLEQIADAKDDISVDKRLAIFFSLSLAILVAHSFLMAWLAPPKAARKDQPQAKQVQAQPEAGLAKKAPPEGPKAAAKPPESKPAQPQVAKAALHGLRILAARKQVSNR